MARKSPNRPAAAPNAAPSASKPKAAAKPPVTRHQPPPPASKAATVLAALKQPGGTTLAELSKVTGWQAHSVRGFLSGTVRKKLGLALTSEASTKGRIYRIVTVGKAA